MLMMYCWLPVATPVDALCAGSKDYHQQYLAKPGNRQYCSAMPTGTPLPPYSEWKPDGVDGKEPFLPKEFWAAHGPQPGCTIAGPNAQIIWP
eukprot:gene11081-29107_t